MNIQIYVYVYISIKYLYKVSSQIFFDNIGKIVGCFWVAAETDWW